jgi:hypothetical protein
MTIMKVPDPNLHFAPGPTEISFGPFSNRRQRACSLIQTRRAGGPVLACFDP